MRPDFLLTCIAMAVCSLVTPDTPIGTPLLLRGKSPLRREMTSDMSDLLLQRYVCTDLKLLVDTST